MADPLAEDKDSPVAGITHRYPDKGSFSCEQCLRHVLQALHKKKEGGRY